jgi:hypothetical protein
MVDMRMGDYEAADVPGFHAARPHRLHELVPPMCRLERGLEDPTVDERAPCGISEEIRVDALETLEWQR